MTQIQIKHVTKAWGDRELFRDVTFSAEFGEHIALVGANGAGKSTLLHILEGSDQADGGSIRIPLKSSTAFLRQNPLSDRELERLKRDGIPAEGTEYLRLFGMQADAFGPLRIFRAAREQSSGCPAAGP
jgi:ATPase subunit of ABC transporter with duplicated ATPase domains